MPKKKETKTDKDQPSLYGEVDELYNLLSAHESADKEAVDAARKRVINAEEHYDETKAQLANTQKAMSIVERRRDELKPKAKKKQAEAGGKIEREKDWPTPQEQPGAKGRIEGKRPQPKGKAPKATPPPPKSDAKEN